MRRLFTLTALAVALLASGCGVEDEVHEADTEGLWVDAGPLDYQIQGSRQLIATQVPDDRYLDGLPEDAAEPTPEETWFAVFVRIENKTDAPAEAPRLVKPGTPELFPLPRKLQAGE